MHEIQKKLKTERFKIAALAMVVMAIGVAWLAGSAAAQTVTAPTVSNGFLSVLENGSTTGTLVANDTNAPALPLSFTIVGSPADGAISNLSAASGTFTYTPNSGFIGSDSFQFIVNNGTETSATGTEMISVEAPAATSTTSTSTGPVISGISAMASDTQATVTWTTDQSAGSQVFYGTNTFYGASSNLDSTPVTSHSVILSGLTPNTTYHFYVSSGNASGTVTSSSDEMFTTLTSSMATSTTSSTTAPIASVGTINVAENGSATGTLTANDTNTPVLPLAFSIVSDPLHGTLSNVMPTSGAFTYTPNNNFAGNDSFTFMVNNGVLNSAIETETINVAASSSTAPIISNISTMASDTQATITWTTDQSANSEVAYGLSAGDYPWMQTMSTSTTNHRVTLFGLTQDTTYHFMVTSMNASGTAASSSDQAFTTIMTPVATSTASSTDITAMEAEIQQLEQEILALLQQIISGNTGVGAGNGNGNGNSTGTQMMPPSIDQQNASVRGGTSIDFTGRNFAPNELVTVMSNGQMVTTARADGGGNFSTGSLPVSSVTSSTSETYNFTGQTSGITQSATIMITP